MDDLISVIIPVYNVERYLPTCIDSVIGQTYTNLEIILIDDGSTDLSGGLCDIFAARDDRIHVIHQPNQGLSAARNAGLAVIAGSCVTFVDSDDWLHPECIERLHSLFKDGRADVSVCNMVRTKDEGATANSAVGEILELSRSEAIEHIVKPRYGSMVAACGKLYRSELLSDIRFPVGRLHEDAFTTYRIVLKSHIIRLTTEPLYFYRQRPESIMNSPFSVNAKLDIIDALTERSVLLHSAGLTGSGNTTSGQVLQTFMEIDRHAQSHPEGPVAHEVDTVALARRLRSLRQPPKFKFFYSLFLHCPNVARRVYLLGRDHRKNTTL